MSTEEQKSDVSNIENLPAEKTKLLVKKVKDRISKKESIELEVDKRTTISKYNRFSHGHYADLPAYCNNCVFRAREEGGGGQCPSYQKDALCSIRKDIGQFIQQYDTRKPEDLKSIIDHLVNVKLEDVLMSTVISRMDGNLPDKSQRAEFNSVVQLLKLAADINTVKVTATQGEVSGANGLEAIFKTITMQRVKAKENDQSNR